MFIFSLFCSVSVLNTLTKYFFLQIFNLTSYSLWFSIFHQPSPPRLCKFYLSTFFTPIYFVSSKIIFPYFASYLFPRILRDLTNTSTEFSSCTSILQNNWEFKIEIWLYSTFLADLILKLLQIWRYILLFAKCFFFNKMIKFYNDEAFLHMW